MKLRDLEGFLPKTKFLVATGVGGAIDRQWNKEASAYNQALSEIANKDLPLKQIIDIAIKRGEIVLDEGEIEKIIERECGGHTTVSFQIAQAIKADVIKVVKC